MRLEVVCRDADTFRSFKILIPIKNIYEKFSDHMTGGNRL